MTKPVSSKIEDLHVLDANFLQRAFESAVLVIASL